MLTHGRTLSLAVGMLVWAATPATTPLTAAEPHWSDRPPCVARLVAGQPQLVSGQVVGPGGYGRCAGDRMVRVEARLLKVFGNLHRVVDQEVNMPARSGGNRFELVHPCRRERPTCSGGNSSDRDGPSTRSPPP